MFRKLRKSLSSVPNIYESDLDPGFLFLPREFTIDLGWFLESKKFWNINSHGTRRLYPNGTRRQCTAKTFYYGVFDAYRFKLFRSFFGSFPVKFSPKKNFFEHFIAPTDSSLNIRGSLLSFHFRKFWQSTASSYHDC